MIARVFEIAVSTWPVLVGLAVGHRQASRPTTAAPTPLQSALFAFSQTTITPLTRDTAIDKLAGVIIQSEPLLCIVRLDVVSM